MTFQNRIIESDACFMAYCTISGLPYVWSNATLPAEWAYTASTVQIGSETYAWTPRMSVDSLKVSSKAEPWAGLGTTGSLDVTFNLPGNQSPSDDVEDDPLFSITNTNIFRGDLCVLTADLTPAATTATVDNNSAFPTGGPLYIGLETCTYSSKPIVTLFGGMTRGRWGSQARSQFASASSVEESGDGGTYIADHPLVMNGRLLRLWLASGYLDTDGYFVPYSSSIQGDDDEEVYAGVIQGWEYSTDMLSVTLHVNELQGYLDREIATRLPRGYCSGGLSAIYIGSDNNQVDAWWIKSGENAEQISGPLTTDGSTEVTAGFYSYSQIARYLNETITAQTSTAGLSDSYSLAWEGQSDGTIVVKLVVFCDTTAPVTSDWDAWQFSIYPQEPNSIWREFGYIDRQEVWMSDGGDGTSEPAFGIITAPRGFPLLRLPKGNENRWIPYTALPGPSFDVAPGWDDDNGSPRAGYVKIGKEICPFDVASTATVDGANVTYIRLSGRGTMGSRYDEETYVELNLVEAQDEDALITQVMAFPDTSIGLVFLYLMHSGSGTKDSNGDYDQGWRGTGAYIDADLVDYEAFIDLDQVSSAKRNHCITEATTVRDFIANELVINQCFLIQTNTGSRQQLTAKRATPIQESSGAGAVTLTHSHVDTKKGIVWEMSEDRIINQIVAENVGYNPASDKSRETVTHRNGTSTGTWGASEPIQIDMRGFIDPGNARDEVQNIANTLYSMWSAPFGVLEIDIASASRCWSVDIGDLVSISHELVPTSATVSWGVTGLIGTVYGVERTYRGKGPRGRLTLVCGDYGGYRRSLYAPTMHGSALGGTSNKTITIDDHYWSCATDTTRDIENFEVGYKVRVYQPGSESTAVNTSIASFSLTPTADSSTVTVANSLSGLTAPVVVEFLKYDTEDYADEQYTYVHMSDGDRKLTTFGGTEYNPFYYGNDG